MFELATGRSPTHDSYLEARRRGKRISAWLQSDASGRQGDAANFAQEVRAFHSTGGPLGKRAGVSAY